MKSLGLALSGGGIKGIAHIGVYKILKDHGVQIECLAGTSAGAFVAAGIAMNKEPEEILETVQGYALEKKKILQWKMLHIQNGGLINTIAEEKMVEKMIPKSLRFEDLKIPLRINAVNLESGEEEVFDRGSIYEAVLASASIPGIYPPLHKDGKLYVDGGLLNNLPVRICKDMNPSYILAIDVMRKTSPENFELNQYFFESNSVTPLRKRLKRFVLPVNVLMRSIAILQKNQLKSQLEASPPDALICPEVYKYHPFDFEHCLPIYRAGLKAGKKWIRGILSSEP